MRRVIACDVNETLLDVGALEPDFKEVFGDAHVLNEWFATPAQRNFRIHARS
jgi:2-haloacid dehalogenase